MNIKEYTLTAEASKNYQKMVVSITVDDVKDEAELASLKQWLIAQSTAGVDELSSSVQATTKPLPERRAEEKPMQRVIMSQLPPQQPAANMNAKVASDYHIGDTKVFDGVEYSLHYSKKNNQWFWGINDVSLVAKGYKQYRRDGLE